MMPWGDPEALRQQREAQLARETALYLLLDNIDHYPTEEQLKAERELLDWMHENQIITL